MSVLAERYTRMLMALLPPGAIWPREPGTVRHALMSATAEEMALIHQWLEAILAERSPRTALYLLSDWERVLGLPDDCTGPAETIAARRAQAHARMVSTGGQSRAYMIEVARALGYGIEIIEHRTRYHGLRRHGEHYGGPDMQFTWTVIERSGTVRLRRYGQAFHGEPYQTWGNYPLVCLIRRLAPAHTIVLFE